MQSNHWEGPTSPDDESHTKHGRSDSLGEVEVSRALNADHLEAQQYQPEKGARRGSIFDAITDLWGGSSDEAPLHEIPSSEREDGAKIEVLAASHSEVCKVVVSALRLGKVSAFVGERAGSFRLRWRYGEGLRPG